MSPYSAALRVPPSGSRQRKFHSATKVIAMTEQVSRALALSGIEIPIYQAGLGGVAGPDLAAAVSREGGLGHLGCIRRSAADVRQWIRETRKRTDRPFGVNLVPPGGGPDGFEAQL